MAQFVELTDITTNDHQSVLINVDHVVFVRSYNGKTWVGTTAIVEGTSRSFIVQESPKEVWKMMVPTPGRT